MKPLADADESQLALRGAVTDVTEAMHFTVAIGSDDDIIVRTTVNAGPGPASPRGSGPRVVTEWNFCPN